MEPRKMMLIVLGAGSLTGLVLGATTSTTMKPAPEPPWRHSFQPPAPSNESYRLVDVGPQDLSPFWDAESRLPTWKRQMPLAPAVYMPVRYDDAAPEPAFAREDHADLPPPRDLAALDQAAAASNAADDARAAAADEDADTAALDEPEVEAAAL